MRLSASLVAAGRGLKMDVASGMVAASRLQREKRREEKKRSGGGLVAAQLLHRALAKMCG